MRAAYGVHLMAESHAGLFEILPKRAVYQPDGREILHAGEPDVLQRPQEMIAVHEGIGSVHSGNDGGPPDHRQDLFRHFGPSDGVV